METYLNDKALKLHQGAIRAMFDKAGTMTDVVSMGIGEPDMPTPESICLAGIAALNAGTTHYTPNAGFEGLRQAVSEYYATKGLCYDPEKEIIITNGGMGALSTLMLVVLNVGDEVLIQDPQWLNYAAQVELCGGHAVRVPARAENNFEMQAGDIRSAITSRTKAIIVNSPNNPTGTVISRKSIEEIAAVARENNILVISDEVYNTLVYNGCRLLSIAQLEDMKDRVVVINSCSKAFAMTGWRIGFAAGPEQIIDKMVKAQENLNSCANAPGQRAAEYAIRNFHLSEQLTEVFAKRRELVLQGLREIEGLHFCEPEGAFYVFPDIRAFGLSSAEFCNRLLDEERVVCIPGSAFGQNGEGYIRISYTCSEKDLLEALARLKHFCSKLDRQHRISQTTGHITICGDEAKAGRA